MDILVMISVASTMFLIGFFAGQAQKQFELKNTQKNYEQGLYEGAQIALELMDKHMKGGADLGAGLGNGAAIIARANESKLTG